MSNKRKTVRVIITRKEQNKIVSFVLMYRERDGEIYYVTIGGGIETGESEMTALLREIQEESGLEVSIEKKIDQRYEMHDGLDDEISIYLATYISGEIGPVYGAEREHNRTGNVFKVVEIVADLPYLEKVPIIPERAKRNILSLIT